MVLNFFYATQILRARIKQTNRVDINVLEECVAQSTSNMNNNNGRVFCYFCSRPDDSPVLLTFIREHIDQDISHIFAFYVNKKFKIIQPTERKRFANKLQEGARLGLEVKLGVVNADTSIPKFLHTSILIQMAEFMLDISLATNFIPTRQVTGCVFSSFVCFNPQIPFPTCRPKVLSSNAEKIWDHLRRKRIHTADVNLNNSSGSISPLARVLRIPYKGHVIYGVKYQPERALMIILPHPSLFRCHEDAVEFQDSIRKLYKTHQPEYIGPARFYGRPTTTCTASDVLMSILIMLELPLAVIKQCDVNFVLKDDDDESTVSSLISSSSSQEPIEAASVTAPGPSDMSDEVDDEEEWVPTQEILLAIDMATCQPSSYVPNEPSQTLSIDSQATVICSQHDIDNQLAEIARLRSIKLSLKCDYPTRNAVKPMDDPDNRILKDMDFFHEEIDLMIESFNLPATLLPITSVTKLPRVLANTIEKSNRLLILPIVELKKVLLLIIDRKTSEWGLIDPDAASQRERTSYNRINLLLSHESSQFNDFEGIIITIPCIFHAKLQLMHLILSVYRICQAFDYAKMLPKRLTYTERRLRDFCYVICRELQMRNAQYNSRNGLVQGNGFLKEGAFRALPSLVQFERSVVATDLCLFCDSRAFKKLGTHMAMNHGGQAKTKRERRKWKESL